MASLGFSAPFVVVPRSLWKILGVLAVFLCCAVGLAVPGWALDPPAVKGYVNDYARILRPETVLQLEQALRSFDEADSTQVAVLTIDSLEGDSLEDFSIRVVDAWKIGQRGKDNGVLFLVVKNDRKMRIEVGRGLEGVLTDLAAGRIIDNVVRPLFRAERFEEGILSGVAAIIQTCRGEYSAPARPGPAQGQEPPKIVSYLFFCVFIVAFLGRASRPLGMLAGAFLLPLAAFLGLPSIGLLLLLLLMPAGALAGLIVPLLLGNMLLSAISMGGRGFGGGSGGGGFGGFGGGGFGGGGASGGW